MKRYQINLTHQVKKSHTNDVIQSTINSTNNNTLTSTSTPKPNTKTPMFNECKGNLSNNNNTLQKNSAD